MTRPTISHDSRSGDVSSPIPTSGIWAAPTVRTNPAPSGPVNQRQTYDPIHLLGEIVVRFEHQGQLPHESVPKDIDGAIRACRRLLVALGIKPVMVTKLAASVVSR